jgi:hypothetical protein
MLRDRQPTRSAISWQLRVARIGARRALRSRRWAIDCPTWRTSLRSLEPDGSKACTLHRHFVHLSRGCEIDAASFGIVETDLGAKLAAESDINEARVIEARTPESVGALSGDNAVVEDRPCEVAAVELRKPEDHCFPERGASKVRTSEINVEKERAIKARTA